MAKALVVTEIVFDRLPELQGKLRQRVGHAVRKTALDIESNAKQMAPVDTGFLKNSIYTVTSGHSGYEAAKAAAENRRSKHAGTRRSRRQGKRVSVENLMLPPVEQPTGDLQAVVAVGAKYGIYVEMAAQPFLGPAAEQGKTSFERDVAKALVLYG